MLTTVRRTAPQQAAGDNGGHPRRQLRGPGGLQQRPNGDQLQGEWKNVNGTVPSVPG